MKNKTIIQRFGSVVLATALAMALLQPLSANAQGETEQGIENQAIETEQVQESMRFPFDNPPGILKEEHIKSMWVGDLIYLKNGFRCEAIENAVNVEIKEDYSYPFSIRFIKEGTVKIKVFSTETPETEEIYEFKIQAAKEPYVEQLVPSKIKIGDYFGNLYIYHNSLLGIENGFAMSELTRNEQDKNFMTGINWGGAWATDPETRILEGYLPGAATKPGTFKIAAERDAANPYEVTIEEPVIQSNLPETITIGTEMDVTTSLENTSLKNMKVEDIVKWLTEERGAGGYPEGCPRYPIGYQPKLEIVEGAELVERSNPDYTNTLTTSEIIKFIGEGTVKFKITYDMDSFYQNILKPDDRFGYLAPNGFPIAIYEEAMYSPTAMFAVNVSSKIPSEPVDPEQPNHEGTKPSEEKIQDAINEINASDKENEITIDMGSATVVPKEILEAAKGKDVDVKFVMKGYTWTINGKDISVINLKDINLEVKFDTNAVPQDVVKELAGNNPVKQLSLTHNGEFGFKATLTMNAGKEYGSKYGNLYYYNNKNLEFMTSGNIAEDGNVNLDFSHASDYVLVMSDTDMGKQETQNNPSGTQNVKTGDETSALPYVVILFACLGVGGIIIKRRHFAK